METDIEHLDLSKNNQIETKPPLKTNRVKALVSMNLYAIFSVLFVVTSKYAVKTKGVARMDLTFLVQLIPMPISALIIACNSNLTFRVPNGKKCIFYTRASESWLLVLFLVMGSTLVPVTVQ